MRSSKRILAAVLAVIVLCCAGAATPTVVEAAKKVTVKSVKVQAPYEKSMTIAKGKKVKLSSNVTVTPNKSANKKVTYKSNDTSIAAVDSKGNVTAKKAGKTKIVVTSVSNKNKKATISVKVVNPAVTKVKLNKTKASTNIGDKLTLKATATVKKGGSKTIYWKSSNTKVATVSQKGVVTSVGAGKTTITATAADGSKKKATCTVTVVNTVSMKSVNILNGQSVTFTLDRAYALDASKVVVKKKQIVNGSYNKTLQIDNVYTTDKKTYTVVLSGNDVIYENEYVSISVPSLPGKGTKTLEKQYTTSAVAYSTEVIYTGTVGQSLNKSCYFSYNGYSAYTVTGLPAGVSYTVNAYNNVVFKGVPTAAGVTRATVNAVDELGNKKTFTAIFCIGSSSKIVAAATQAYILKGADSASLYYNGIAVSGGSGNYTYTVAQNYQGVTVDSDGELSGSIPLKGDYTYTVTVKDANNAALTATVFVVVHVAQGNTVTGIVTDAAGNPMSDVDLTFTNKNKTDKYKTYGYTYTNSNGSYSIVLPAGTFDIAASYEYADTTRYIYNKAISASGSLTNISLPLYQVIPVLTSNSSLTFGYWKNEATGDYVGYGNKLYMKPGKYTISYTTSGVITETKYKATFTVSNTAMYAPVTVSTTARTDATVRTIGLGTSTMTSGSSVYYGFTPSVSGTYVLTSTDSEADEREKDPYVYLYSSTGEQLSYNDDGGTGYNFSLSYYMTAGTTYYYQVGGCDTSVSLTKE